MQQLNTKNMNLKYTIKNLFPASYLKRLGHHTFFLILVLLLACCKNQKPPVAVTEKDPDEIQFFSLSIPDLLKNRREVNLSEIAESAEYIELETTDESLLGPIANAIFTKEFIFVEQYNRPLAQFDMSGKFIRHIGRLGKGPEEYTMIREFSIDEERRKIYIQPNYIRVIQVYSFEGNFLKTIRLPEDLGFIVWSRDSLFMCYNEADRGTEEFIFTERNSNAEILQAVRNNYFWENNSPMSWSYFNTLRNTYYRFNKRLFFKGWYNDTVYTYDKHNKIIPAFFLDLGGLKLPDELRIQVTGKLISSPDYYWASAKETAKFLFITYCTHAAPDNKIIDYGLICYDKSSNTGTTLKGQNENSKFINDIDGGPGFWPEYTTDSISYYVIEAAKMKKHLAADNNEEADPDQKDKLREMFKNLDESDNPVIMKVRLKTH